ncbi:hypothetical protein SJR91_17390, partial [Aeromonas caviae]|uniref:hypothetical protein n=1 Tax=Aeromonas caviae TaxID=648 RepID=UPI0029D80B50
FAPSLAMGRFGASSRMLGFATLCANRHEMKPTFNAKRICIFVLPSDLIHVYPALVDVNMLIGWASLGSAPTGKKHATAPEFQPPACCAFPVAPVWFMADSDKR